MTLDIDSSTQSPGFFFRQEPYQLGDRASEWLAFGSSRDQLALRIRHSRGGAFLLCGFRGVGKTSLVNSVLDELPNRSDEHTFIKIRLPIARPIQPVELIFSISRRLYEELRVRGLLKRLPKQIAQQIWLNYTRTAASVVVSNTNTREDAVSFGGNSAGGPKPNLSWGGSTRLTSTMGSSFTYLAYGQSDAEDDLTTMVGLLSRTRLAPKSLVRRLLGKTDPPISLILVLDELDKLTTTGDGLTALRALLTSLKAILSTTGIHIVCVAGVDLYDEARRDARQGNGVYESLFSWIDYVPCRWFGAADFLEAIGVRLVDPEVKEVLIPALDFSSRGNLRRLSQDVSRLIVIDQAGTPSLSVNGVERERVALFAELDDIVTNHTNAVEIQPRQTIGSDRLRLSTYAICDWVLGTQGAVFSAEQLVEGPLALSSQLGVSRTRVERFLARLADSGFIEAKWRPGRGETVVPAAREVKYRLSDDARHRLAALALADPDSVSPESLESPDLLPPWALHVVAPEPWSARSGNASGPAWPPMVLPRSITVAAPTTGAVASTGLIGPGDVLLGRWAVGELLGVGGSASVYRANDLFDSHVSIVLKVFDTPLTFWHPEEWEEGWGSGARLLGLRSDNVCGVHAAVSTGGGQLALVERYVGGDSLITALRDGGSVDWTATLRDITGGVRDAHTAGLCNLDVKPHNIIISPGGDGATLIDIDLSSLIDPHFRSRSRRRRVGTPNYVAPEVFRDMPFSASADIYSLGVVFAEMAGISLRPAANETTPANNAASHPLGESVILAASLPVEVKHFLMRCVPISPDERFQSVDELQDAMPWSALGEQIHEAQLSRVDSSSN